MSRHGRSIRVIIAGAVVLLGLQNVIPAKALAPPSGTILIGQIKITSSSGQFVSLYNNTAAEIDMSTVQLAYYNYYDLASPKLTSSRYIPLSGKLAAHSYYLVSDGAMTICYKMTVNAQSLGFSSTAGTLQVTQNGPSNVLDSVAWSKTAVLTPSGVQTLPTSTSGFLQRAWLDGIAKSANDPWISVMPSGVDGCDLQTQIAASATPLAPVANTTPQTVTAVAASDGDDVTSANNLGLVAPNLTELLPNPGAPQTDDSDEFIELYNPNDAVFNLTGYRLEAGATYSRGYTFAIGSLQPKSYTALMITDTYLQLSNSEGQVRLLDPAGTTISETPSYEDAPDGETWSLIGDSWQWSDTLTPNAANLPSATLPSTTSSKTATKAPKAAKTTTTKKATTGKVAGASTTTPSSGNAEDLQDAAPLHPSVLAGVGAAAVGYALYEYRKDMANRFFKLRRYFQNRRAARARL